MDLSDIGRNDKCHCGSDKKYKKCCMREDEKIRRLKKKHKDREQEISTYFSEVSKEVNTVHSDNGSYSPERVQLVVVFTWIDVLSNYWDLYQCKSEDAETSGPRERCEAWMDEFLFTEKNEKYAQNEELRRTTPSDLYELRNGIVHFMGMGNIDDDSSIVIVPNDMDPESRKNYTEKVRERLGEGACLFKPDLLHESIQDGAELMLERMLGVIDEIKSGNRHAALSHMQGIKAIYEKYREEGAVKVKNPSI